VLARLSCLYQEVSLEEFFLTLHKSEKNNNNKLFMCLLRMKFEKFNNYEWMSPSIKDEQKFCEKMK